MDVKNKNLQIWALFIVLEIKQIMSNICRWYFFFAKNHFPTQNLLSDAGNVLSIDHTYAYKEGMGVGSLLVSAINDYAVSVVWYQRHPQFQDILDRKD